VSLTLEPDQAPSLSQEIRVDHPVTEIFLVLFSLVHPWALSSPDQVDLVYHQYPYFLSEDHLESVIAHEVRVALVYRLWVPLLVAQPDLVHNVLDGDVFHVFQIGS